MALQTASLGYSNPDVTPTTAGSFPGDLGASGLACPVWKAGNDIPFLCPSTLRLQGWQPLAQYVFLQHLTDPSCGTKYQATLNQWFTEKMREQTIAVLNVW